MQVAHPIIAPTIDNNGIYSIVIDNNRTRADSRIYSGISSKPNGIERNRTRTGNIKNMVLVQKTMELIIIELELIAKFILVLVQNPMELIRIELELITKMVLVQKPMELIKKN